MPAVGKRIDTIKVTAVTGRRGLDGPVRIRLNDQDLPLHRISGGTKAGETFEGEFFVATVVRSCQLLGPNAGSWDLRTVDVEYAHSNGHKSLYRAGPLELAAGAATDILSPLARPAFEV